jgi:gas vesicle protein
LAANASGPASRQQDAEEIEKGQDPALLVIDKCTERRKEKDMSADKGGFGWFLVGLGIGAAVGVLYAPKPGSETRDDLASSAREGSEYVKQRSREAADKVSDLADRSREQLNEYVDKGKDAVDKGRAQWNQYVDRGRQVVGDQVDKVNAAVEEGKRAYQNTATANDADRISSAVEAGQQAYRTT